MSKQEKIRLILLEGPSDHKFFRAFRSKYDLKHVDILLLKRCTLNFRKIDDVIKTSMDLNFKAIWLIMDLKTQKLGTETYYTRKDELISVYKKNLKALKAANKNTSFAVMVKDLECWQLVYFGKHNNTETIDNAETEIKKLLDIKGGILKPELTQRLLNKPDFWEKLIQHKDKNRSLNDFLDAVLDV